jgi:threonine/homoserine/homoserine lactone efflux protein
LSPDTLLAFAATSAVLLAMPGPNVALIVGTSVSHGVRRGLFTVLGTSTAMVLQLGVTALGMATFMTVLAEWFAWLRWAGAGYLVYLGVKTWRSAGAEAVHAAQARPSLRATFVRGLLVSLTNPKTLLFYGAFLPQFVSPGDGARRDLLVLSATFVCMAIVMDGTWALLGDRARSALERHRGLTERLSGGLLVSAGAGLALARRP